MSGATGADLVAAVSEAGGLGTLGVSSMTAEEIRVAVETIRARTSRPFGLNLLLFTVDEDQIDAVVTARPRVIATAWPRPEDDLLALAITAFLMIRGAGAFSVDRTIIKASPARQPELVRS